MHFFLFRCDLPFCICQHMFFQIFYRVLCFFMALKLFFYFPHFIIFISCSNHITHKHSPLSFSPFVALFSNCFCLFIGNTHTLFLHTFPKQHKTNTNLIHP
uniref:ZZ3 n=1 Tax=Bacillus pumilus TaxID=1408 RepID=D1MGL2_BACPU|nr:ZZ3 [Bacillus pumilus]